jgi:hypothetical protein
MVDMGAWKNLVSKAERSMILEDSLAQTTLGLSHSRAQQILDLEGKRRERERQEFIVGKMDRPGQVLRQKATILDKAVRMVKK